MQTNFSSKDCFNGNVSIKQAARRKFIHGNLIAKTPLTSNAVTIRKPVLANSYYSKKNHRTIIKTTIRSRYSKSVHHFDCIQLALEKIDLCRSKIYHDAPKICSQIFAKAKFSQPGRNLSKPRTFLSQKISV